MPIQILSPARHRHLTWKRFDGYAHAARQNLVSLAAVEIAKAALAVPLAFTHYNGHWSLNAVLGFVPGQSLLVADNGQWLGTYVPASLRAHPFHLGWNGTEANLCVDEGSELLVTDQSGEPIFSENGGLSAAVEQIWSFLSTTADSLLALEEACATLAASGVIEPWLIDVRGPDGTRTVEGLHRVSEAALNNLEDVIFGKLRRAGIAGIAYAQILSMGNLAKLGELAQARAEADAAKRARAEVQPMVVLPLDSTIDWDWSKIGR